jgi:hypothetical protein
LDSRGIALGCADLVDHDQLHHDSTMALLAGRLSAGRKDCAPLAGKPICCCNWRKAAPMSATGR